MENLECCICHRMCHDTIGNNPEPVYTVSHGSGRCCNDCNRLIVLPTRIAMMRQKQAKLDIWQLRQYMKACDRKKVLDQVRHKVKAFNASVAKHRAGGDMNV